MVRSERPEQIEIQPEESPVGESKSNGEVERAIQSVQGQIRSLKSSLESRCKCTIIEDCHIWPLLVMHASILINICHVGDDGRMAYERRKGRKFKRDLPEIGECVWYLRPESVGKDKADVRWENGIFAGVRIESGEFVMMTEEGVIMYRSFARVYI